jgi:NAD(P)-dependent dehydrogenase (short-subunit alcohol dehydrogenase family)
MVSKKVAVITGGEQGLGFALSDLLLKEGFVVFSLDLSQSSAIDNKHFLKVDISDEKQVVKAFSKIKSVDALINNAGVMRRGFTFQSSVKDFDFLFSVNVKGTWLVTKHALPMLNKNAQVLMISSRHSSLPNDPGLYGLSKKNVELLGDLLGREPLAVKKGIVVKTAILGPFKTKLSMTGYSKEDYAKRENLLSKEIVASKILKLILSDKKKLVYKGK